MADHLARIGNVVRCAFTDVPQAVRSLKRTPVLTVTAFLVLSAGIALPTAAFTVLRGVFLADLPFDDADRIVMIRDYHRQGRYDIHVTADEFTRRAALRSFDALAAFHARRVDIVIGSGAGIVVPAAFVTPSALMMTGVRPVRGRLLDSADAVPDAPRVALIGAAIWRSNLGSDPEIIGRRILVGGVPHEVAGVLPAGFAFPTGERVWLPLATRPGNETTSAFPLRMFGRLREGVTRGAAAAELAALPTEDRAATDPAEQIDVLVMPFTRAFGDVGQIAIGWAVVAGLTLLLLVAAANVAHLFVARNAARSREIALRTALGASRSRLVTLLTTEVLLLGTGAAVLGTAGARAALAWFVSAAGDNIPYWADPSLNGFVLGFAALLAILATCAAGLAPAWKATGIPPAEVLRRSAGGRTTAFGRISRYLTVGEVLLSVGFLGVAGMLARGILGVGYGDAVRGSDVLVAQLYFGQPAMPDGASREQRRETWNTFLDTVETQRALVESRLSRLPGVRGVAFASHFPGNELPGVPFELATDSRDGVVLSATRVVEARAGLIELLGGRALSGRLLRPDEVASGAQVAVVNESFARRFIPGAAVGHRVRFPPAGSPADHAPWLEIVGVVLDLGLNPTDPARGDGVYVPMPATNILRLGLSVAGDPGALMAPLHSIAAELDSRVQVQWALRLDEQMSQPLAVFRGLGVGLSVAGAAALVLSAASLYALMAFAVTQRRREIGIRIAVGARPASVVATMLGQGLRHMLAGSLLGVALAMSLSRMVRVIPFDVPSGDPLALVILAAVFLAAGLAATVVPARRVLALQPLEALRGE